MLDEICVKRINECLQKFLNDKSHGEVTAVDAAKYLDEIGLLSDSRLRPGLPLRNLLREGRIVGADQRPPQAYGRWWIKRVG